MTDQAATKLPFTLDQVETVPTIPATAQEIVHCIERDDPVENLLEIIERDPATSFRVMQMANSSLFHDGDPLTNLAAATSVLSLRVVQLASLRFTLPQTHRHTAEDPAGRHTDGTQDEPFADLDLRRFWQRSLVRARAARAVAQRLQPALAGEAFLCGLLARLGSLLMAQVMPAEYAALARESDGWPSVESEAASLGLTCADMTAEVLESARLPSLLCQGASFAYGDGELPDNIDQESADVAEFTRIAASVTTVLCDNPCEDTRAALFAEAMQRLGMSQAAVERLLTTQQVELERATQLTAASLTSREQADLMQRALGRAAELGLGGILDLELTRMCASGLEVENQDLEGRARIDRLTGLPNRASFDDFLERQIHGLERGARSGSLGLILLDLDFFKRLNDAHGHQAGDEALRTVGRTLRDATRRSDFAARYGGEEFAIVVPNSNPRGIQSMCERLRAAIENEPFEFGGTEFGVTTSIGAALLHSVSGVEAGIELIRIADECLYRAKAEGRNCWRVESSTSSSSS